MIGPVTTDPRVDAYLAGLPVDQRDLLEGLRRRVMALAPNAVETIAYDMPALRLDDHFLLSYAGWKRHCSIYPVGPELLDAYADALRGYGRTGKGSLHFSPDRPLPAGLLEDLVRGRVASIEAGGR
jgi:uncharacterized protein YdhG (YjbR/CyaY superfamily)